MQTAEKNAGSLAVEVKRASEHIEKRAERARVAESAQNEAHSQLKSAGLEASTARKLVEAVSGILFHLFSHDLLFRKKEIRVFTDATILSLPKVRYHWNGI